MSIEQQVETDFVTAIRIILEHVPMSTDARKHVLAALGDREPPPPPAPVDPRDAAIAELQAKVAALTAPQVQVSGPPEPQASEAPVAPELNQPQPAPAPAEPDAPAEVPAAPADTQESDSTSSAPAEGESADASASPVNPQIMPSEG